MIPMLRISTHRAVSDKFLADWKQFYVFAKDNSYVLETVEEQEKFRELMESMKNELGEGFDKIVEKTTDHIAAQVDGQLMIFTWSGHSYYSHDEGLFFHDLPPERVTAIKYFNLEKTNV